MLPYFNVAFLSDRGVQARLSGHGVTGERRLGRLLLVAFMLLVFGLRDYAVQTHIDPVSFGSVAVTKSVAPGHHKNLPDEKDNCPLCQQLYGGQYVAPEALPFFLSILTVSTIAAVMGVAPHYDAVSHNWRGRGPPRS